MGSHTSAIQIDDGPFEVPGFAIGHWTHPDKITGCSVILADRLSPGAVEVRGGSPGTRETDLLGTGRAVQSADAILLTGGSAFGLSAADGVVRWLRERGRGYPTGAINVPIVPGAVIFDLEGDEPAWPDPDAGYAAVDAASLSWISGRHGGGAGARTSKVLGRAQSIRTGIGVAQVSSPAGTVSAVIVNNAFGDVVDDRDGRLLTSPGGRGISSDTLLLGMGGDTGNPPNTVLGVIVVDRSMDHDALARIAMAGQSGLARVIRPSHSPADGDTIFALASEAGTCSMSDLMQLSVGAQLVAARATVNSTFTRSESASGGGI